MDSNKIFGTQLRELRKKAGLTLRELAEKVNVNFTYLSKIENGALPPPSEKVIRHLAEVLDYDKDELLALAGIIPSDIAEILKDRKARERLRAEQARRAKATGIKMPTLPKVSLPLKGLYRLALPVFLVIAVALSIWYASPTQALQIEYPNQPASGTLGSTYTFYVKVSIEDYEHLPLTGVTVRIYNVDHPSTYKATLTNLPTATSGTVTRNPTEGAGSGTATVSAAAEAHWAYFTATGNVTWESTGYSFSPASSGGYGYQGGTGTTYITYTISWIPPSNWPTGSYQIDTILTTNPRNPGSGTTFTESSNPFTLSAGEAGGGGGGGGGAVSTSGNTYLYGTVTSSGQFIQDVTARSADKLVKLDIDRGVVGKDKTGKGLSKITIKPMTAPPTPPANASTIGLTYDFGPEGATFDPPITLTFDYDPADLPQGVDEAELTIAFYDSATGEWVVLEGITVDTVNNTISGKVSHFTAFAVIAYTEPATFTASDLVIGPSTIEVGKYSMVKVTISNTGDLSGTYDIVLKVNGAAAETKTVTMAGNTSQEVSFMVSPDAAGTYTISIDTLSDKLTVTAPPEEAPAPAPPAPEPEPEPAPPAPEPTPEPAPPAPTPAPAPAPAPEAGANWWLIGGIIAVVIIVAIIIWLMVLRRRE
jgi:transcriptional regulator with XRE-family HTH domain